MGKNCVLPDLDLVTLDLTTNFMLLAMESSDKNSTISDEDISSMLFNSIMSNVDSVKQLETLKIIAKNDDDSTQYTSYIDGLNTTLIEVVESLSDYIEADRITKYLKTLEAMQDITDVLLADNAKVKLVALNPSKEASSTTTETIEQESTPNTKSTLEAPNSEDEEQDGEEVIYQVEDIPVESRIIKKVSAYNMSDIFNNFLFGGLRTKAASMTNLFQDMVAKFWMSTEVLGNRSFFEFDAEVIKDHVRKELRFVVSNYYKKLASKSVYIDYTTDNKFNNHTNPVYFYKSHDKIPPEAARLNKMKDAKTGVKYHLYKSKTIKTDNDEDIYFIVADTDDLNLDGIVSPLIQDVLNKRKRDAHKVQDFTFTELTDELAIDLPKIDKLTAQEYYNNKEVTSAYFARIIETHLDTFVDDNAEMLNKTYREIFRDGPKRSDKIGSDMTNKLMKLTLINTPILHEENDSRLRQRFLINELTQDRDPINALQKAHALTTVDAKGNKIFTFNSRIADQFDPTEFINLTFTGVVLNLGGSKLVIAYNEETGWIIPSSINNDTIKNDEDLIMDLVPESANLLRHIISGLESVTFSNTGIDSLIATFKHTDLHTKDAIELITSVNKADPTNKTFIVQEGNEKYLVETMVDLASDLLHMIPKNISGASLFLQDIFNNTDNSKNRKYAPVARSIYYRFFHKGSYSITAIDPTTGILKTTTHKSLYEQYRSNNNALAGKAVKALVSKMGSTTIDNKGFYENGEYYETNIQGSADIEQFTRNIDISGTEHNKSNIRVLRKDVSNNFVVTKNKDTTYISYYKTGKAVGKAPDFSYKLIKESGRNQYKVTVDTAKTSASKSIVLFKSNIIEDIARTIKLPRGLVSETFLDNLYKAMSEAESQSGSFDVFFGTLIALRLANAATDSGEMTFPALSGVFTTNNNESLSYMFDDNMFKFNDILEEALNKTAGREINTQVKSPGDGILQTIMITNSGKRKQEIINDTKTIVEDPFKKNTNLFKYSKFVGGIMKLNDNGTTKGGIKRGNEGKANRDLNASEESTYYLDGAQLQYAASEKFKKFKAGEGALADRSQSTIFSISSEEFEVLPAVSISNNSEEEKVLDEDTLLTVYKSTMYNSMRGVNDHVLNKWKPVLLKIVAGVLPISYNTDYFKNYGDFTPDSFEYINMATQVINNIKTVDQLHSVLHDLELDYNEVLHMTGLKKNIAVARDAFGHANISYSIVQLSKVFYTKNEEAQDLQNFYIELYKRKYIKYMMDKSTGVELSKQVILTIANRFNIEGDYATKKKKAYEIALTSQFYIDSIGEQELAQLGAGFVFQYKNPKEASLMEVVDMTKGVDASIEDKLQFIRDIEVDGTNGTIDSVDYSEIKSMGEYGNNISHIKTILDAENLSDFHKWQLLTYNDTSTHMSTMYIDRVKRNQAQGSSGVLMALVAPDEPGIGMSETTRTLTFADHTRELFGMGSAGHTNATVYDGPTFNTNAYMYQLNASLGDEFSNYRNTGTAKTVNTSRDVDGIMVYEKTANFPQFNIEAQLYGTARHSNLNRVLMSTIQFKNDFDGYDGLYLDEDIYNSGKSSYDVPISIETLLNTESNMFSANEYIYLKNADKTISLATLIQASKDTENFLSQMESEEFFINKNILDAETFLKHGSYLDTVIFRGMPVSADSLIYDFTNNNITKEELNEGILTTKKFVDGNKIRNKFDLFNYYDNIKSDSIKYNSLKTDEDKATFKKLYPFGWAEYQLTYIMSNYRGDGNHPIRNSEINKVIFETAVKSGASSINPSAAITDPNFDYSTLKVEQISNKALGLLLKATHNPDTTAEYNMSEEVENNQVAATTQAHASAIFQGETIESTERMYEAIGLVSDLNLKITELDISSYKDAAKKTGVSEEKLFMIDVARETIATRKDPGATGESLGHTLEESIGIPIDVKMLRPFVRSAINAKFDKNAVKLRYKGGQYILAPIEDQIKTYTFNNTTGLFRSALNTKNSINGLILEAVLEANKTGTEVNLPTAWKLELVNDANQFIKDHNTNDTVYVYDENGDLLPMDVLTLVNDRELLENLINSKELVSPWDSSKPYKADSIEGDLLNWVQYYRDGENMYESDEFLSFLMAGKAPIDLKEYLDKLNKIKESAAYEIEALSLEEGYTADQLSDMTAAISATAVATENEIYEEVAEYFRSKLNLDPAATKVIPEVLWARFKIHTRLDVDPALDIEELELTPVLGNNIIKNLNSDNDLINSEITIKFLEWLGSFEDNPKEIVNLVQPQFKALADQPGWSTEASEFFMPPHHQSAFLMEFGDNMQDIRGIQEQPNLVKLASILVPDEDGNKSMPLLSEDEVYLLETRYDSIDQEILDIKAKIQDLGGDVGARFIELRDKQQAHMMGYFTTKIDKIEQTVLDNSAIIMASTDNKIRNGVVKRAPLFILSLAKSTDQAIDLISELMKEESVLSNTDTYDTLLGLLELLNTKGTTIQEFKEELDNRISDFKIIWSRTLANNFEKSLSFMTARIPTQGKQQVTIGKIKNFIYSTENNIYAPLELFAMSGADYDIDKQSNITWDVDSSGAILDWKQWIDPEKDINEPSMEDIDNIILNKVNELRRKLSNNPELSSEDIAAISLKFKKSQYKLAARAAQNYSLEQMMSVYKNSKNAMESATFVAMTKIGKIANYLDGFKFDAQEIKNYGLETETQVIGRSIDPDTGEITIKTREVLVPSNALFDAIEKRNHALPFSPSVKLLYEKINMDGKNGIPIVASGLKAYSAAYYATVNNEYTKAYNKELNSKSIQAHLSKGKQGDETEEELQERVHNMILSRIANNKEAQFEKEMMRLRVKERDIAKIREDIPEEISMDNSYFFISKDINTGLYSLNSKIDFLANTRKHLPKSKEVYGKLTSELAKTAYKQLRFATSEEQEVKIIKDYMKAANLHNDFTLEAPAWADLSELLSAATDNAKELILSKIGANSTTTSTIVAMIVMGIDLVDALVVLNDPIVKQAIEEYEEQTNIVKEEISIKERLNVILNKYAENYETKELPKKANQLITDLVIDKSTKLGYNLSDKELSDISANISSYAINKNTYLRDNNFTLDGKYNDLILDVLQEYKSQIRYLKHYNPAKQIELYLRAANDFTSLASQLKINTGMANLERDVLNYIIKIESGLKKLYTFEEFMEAIALYEDTSNEGNKSVLHDMLEKINNKKGTLNIPFILFKNKHYLASLKAVARSNELMTKNSYTARVIQGQLRSKLWKAVTPEDFSAFNNVFDSMAVDLFYNSGMINKKITIDGFGTYDLSELNLVSGNPNEKSRLDFILDTPEVIHEYMAKYKDLANNELLTLFNRGKDIKDKDTNTTISLLAGINTHNTPRAKVSILKLELDNIRLYYPKLYDVLFNYSLIIDRAGLGAGSIASLFGAKPYKDYFKFVDALERDGEIDEIFKVMSPDIFALLAQSLLKEVSTKTKVENEELFYLTGSVALTPEEAEHMIAELAVKETEVIDMSINELQALENDLSTFSIEDYDSTSNKVARVERYWSTRYDVSDMNSLMDKYGERKNKDKTFVIPRVFKSITNGLVYVWHPKLKSFIPVTRHTPVNVASVKGVTGMTLENGLRNIGLDYGWEITVPYENTKGRLLMYSKGKYIVLKQDGTYNKFTASEIESQNPRFILQRNAIRIEPGTHKLKESVVHIIDSETGEVVTNTNIKGKNTTTVSINTNKNVFKTNSNKVYVTPDMKTTIDALEVTEENDIEKSTIHNNLNNSYYTEFKNFVSAIVYALDTPETNNEERFNLALIDATNGKSISFNKGRYTAIKAYFNDNIELLMDSTSIEDKNKGYANMYTMLRSDPKKIIKFLGSTLNIDNLTLNSTDNFIDKVINNKLISQYNFISSVKTPLSIDKDTMGNNSISKNIFLDKYIELLSSKLHINPETYRKINKIDALLIDNILYYDKKLANVDIAKRSEGLIEEYSMPDNIRSLKINKLSKKLINKLGKFLNDRFEGTTVEILSIADIKILHPEINITENTEAFVKTDTGTIILIKERASLDTLLHEMTHLYLAEVKETNLELYVNLMERMKTDPLFEEAKEKYKMDSYNELDILEEIFVSKIQSMHAYAFAERIAEETGDTELYNILFDKDNGDSMLNTYQTMFEAFFNKKIKGDSEITMEDSIFDIMQKIGLDILFFKKNDAMSVFNSKDRRDLKMIASETITRAGIDRIFRKLNYTEKICH